MKKRTNQLIPLFKKEHGLFLGITFGVFLFVLFFQPFPHSNFDFYYRLLFKAGLVGIVFLAMFSVRVLYPSLMGEISSGEKDAPLYSILSGLIIWLLSSIALISYLKNVGFLSFSGNLIIKVLLICLVPPIILLVSDRIQKLKRENKSLILEKGKTQNQLSENQEDYMNFSIDFISGTNGGKLSFILGKILFLKSANNYIEIHYLKEGQIKKKLIRNTLTNIELQTASYPTFIRCHRTCIVNTLYFEKFNGNCNERTLNIRGYNKPIPVSRQYYLKVKEVV